MAIQRTNQVLYPDREWRALAHARLVGLVWTYSRSYEVVDEDFVKPWNATGLFRLLKPSFGFVVARFHRETTKHLLLREGALARLAYLDWRDANRLAEQPPCQFGRTDV